MKTKRKLTATLCDFQPNLVIGLFVALLLCFATPSLATYELAQTLHQPVSGNYFGASVAVQGNEAVIANLDMSAEAAYVFRRQDGVWVKTQTLQLDLPVSPVGQGLLYPTMVAIDGDTLVLGAPNVNFGGVNRRGAVYIFVRDGNNWVQQQRLIGEDGLALGGGVPQFGHAVALAGDTLIVGAPGRDRGEPYTQLSGAVYVYTRTGNTWTLRKTLLSPSLDIINAYFGRNLDMDNGRIVVGEPGNARAYVFMGAGDSWVLEATLAPGDGDILGKNFGISVDVDNGKIAVGANKTPEQGAVYLFLSDGPIWGQIQRLTANSFPAGDFGAALRLEDGRLLVGVPNGGFSGSGQAELFVGNLFYAYSETLYETFNGTVFQLGSALALTDTGAMLGDFERPAPDADGDYGLVYLFEPPSPKLQMTPGILDYAIVAVGGNKLRSVTLENIGDATLHISSLSGLAAPFSRQGGSCGNLLPIVLAPNASCTLTYRFAPNSVGSFSDELTLTSDDPGGSQILTMQGNGAVPQLSLTPALLNVGTAVLGDSTTPVPVTIGNPGAVPVTVTSIPSPSPPFSLDSSTCGATPFELGFEESCTLSYVFTPGSAGEFVQPLDIASSSPDSPDQLVLYGYGDGAGLSASPSDFGGVAVGDSADLNITLFSSGVTDVTVQAISDPAAPFSRIGGDCPVAPFSMPPDVSCNVSYRFSPTTTGPAESVVIVESDATNSLLPVSLLGEGLQPALLLAPGQVDFGAVLPGGSIQQTANMKNIGSLDLEISGITAINAPFTKVGGTCPLPPFTLTPDQLCTLSLQFDPLNIGLFEDSILISSNAPGTPHTLALRGVGADPQLVLTPNSVEFGYIDVGQSSSEELVVIQATGGVKVTISSIGAIPAPFVLVSTDCTPFPKIISGTDGCQLQLRFDPLALGPFNAAIPIHSDANNSPTLLDLSGTGGVEPAEIFADGFE